MFLLGMIAGQILVELIERLGDAILRWTKPKPGLWRAQYVDRPVVYGGPDEPKDFDG